MSELLRIEDLVVRYPVSARGYLNAVDGVSLSIARGEALGLVGESGCGKSSLGKAIVGLAPVHSGSIRLPSAPIAVRGRGAKAFSRAIQIIFQDPYASLNPRMSLRQTLVEPLRVHGMVSRGAANQRVDELLDLVGLPRAIAESYPHEVSGGQRQRIGIARALALEPELIICDEAVSALDVSVQAQILNLLADLKDRLNLTLLFISHDVGVIRHVSDRVAVMYLGQIQELAASEALFSDPAHPYTKALIRSVPLPYQLRPPITLPGDLPDPVNPPHGCRFHTRCPEAEPSCAEQRQMLTKANARRLVRCWKCRSGRQIPVG